MSIEKSSLIGQMLLDAGIVTADQLEIGLREQEKTGDFICTTLVKLGFASEEKVFSVLSQQLNIPYVKLRDREIDPSLIQKVPVKFAARYTIMPLEFKDDVLTVAMTNPLDIRVLDDLLINLGLKVKVKGVLSGELEIQEAIRKYYGAGNAGGDGFPEPKLSSEEIVKRTASPEALKTLAQDTSIIDIVNQMFSKAVKDRATDIHLEPFQNELRVRFRIDGMLYDINIPETIKYFHLAIVACIKFMAGLEISLRKIPQEGRLKREINGQKLDLRVSIIPTIFGESIEIRIIGSNPVLALEDLGFLPEQKDIVDKVIKESHGTVLVTGPVSSGRNTTLYSFLAGLNTSGIEIITVEDFALCQLPGVNQVQVDIKNEFGFAAALKNVLKHDPNIIMVSKIPDAQTAGIVLTSSLIGHLVFSSFHTEDAASLIVTLLDMEIDPFLVSSALTCVIAQRLIRRICPKCKIPIIAKQEIFRRMTEIKFDAAETEIYQGKGCEQCRFTGYYGRTAVFEVLPVTNVIKNLILKRASRQKIRQEAVGEGMITFRESGLRKVISGLTTLSEVERVVSASTEDKEE